MFQKNLSQIKIGKSYIYKNKNKNKIILDSDSSDFSWIRKGVRNPQFPDNYIKHIKDNIGKADIILVSSHKVVRDSLVGNDIWFTLVYPDRSLKSEYINRYKKRGSDDKFIQMLDEKWNDFIDEMESQKECNKIVLKSNQHLDDVLYLI